MCERKDGAGGTEAVADGRLQSWGTPIKISAASRPWLGSVVAQIKDGNRSIIGLT
ncbi:hypothetical protein LN650_08295 [Klebsiella pneumoniae subsp. pneumoniae]|nr:hypothetical protein [Klebsiella pneumoniae subsp. pneumoniae]